MLQLEVHEEAQIYKHLQMWQEIMFLLKHLFKGAEFHFGYIEAGITEQRVEKERIMKMLSSDACSDTSFTCCFSSLSSFHTAARLFFVNVGLIVSLLIKSLSGKKQILLICLSDLKDNQKP